MSTTPAPAPVLHFPTQGIADMEREIRHAAGSILSDVRTRRDHPTYGVTKTGVRTRYAFLRGLVSAFAFLTGQTLNAQSVNPAHVTFREPATRERLADVELAMRNL